MKKLVIASVVGLFVLSTPHVSYALDLPSFFNFNPVKPANSLVTDSINTFENFKSVHAGFDSIMDVEFDNPEIEGQKITQKVELNGESDYNLTENSQEGTIQVAVAGNTMDMDLVILRDGSVYMRLPDMSLNWIETTMEDLEGKNLPYDPKSSDVLTQFKSFAKSIKKDTVKEEGTETVNGIETKKFTMDVDSEKYINELKQSGQAEQIVNGYKDAVIKTTLWIDEKTKNIIKSRTDLGNIRVKVQNPNSPFDEGKTNGYVTVNYSNFDKPVTINKPEGKVVPLNSSSQPVQ